MGLFDGIKEKSKSMQGKIQSLINEQPQTNVAPAQQPQPVKSIFPQKLNSGQYLYKEYQHISICVIEGKEPDFSQLRVGDWLEFRKEPFNKADSNAVAIYDRFQRIGYLWSGTGQDMTNEFLEKGFAVFAFLSEINGNALYMHCAYYKRHASASKK